MEKNLKEEVERFKKLSRIYERSFLDDATDFFDKIINTDEKSEKESFYQDLKDLSEKGGVSKSSSSDDIEKLQKALSLLYDISVDGVYGDETSESVKKFYQDYIDHQYDGEGDESTPDLIRNLMGVLKYKGLTPKEEMKSDDDKKPDIVKSDSKYDSGYITSDDMFYKKILERIDAPVTKENMKFLYAWRQSEGGRARNNPFNTTQRYKGATDYNWVGVKHYLTPEDGLEATVKTILNGRYRCIVDGLRNDIGAENISKCYSDLKTWGTGTLVNTVVSRYNSGAQPNVPPIA